MVGEYVIAGFTAGASSCPGAAASALIGGGCCWYSSWRY